MKPLVLSFAHYVRRGPGAAGSGGRGGGGIPLRQGRLTRPSGSVGMKHSKGELTCDESSNRPCSVWLSAQ